MSIKIGDRVAVLDVFCKRTVSYGVVVETPNVYNGISFYRVNGRGYTTNYPEKQLVVLELTDNFYNKHKRGEKMNITTLVRKILDKDIRTVMEAGYIDADLTLTKDGEDELMGIIFLEKKAELVKAAEEKLKEQKKNK